ncbi:MAG: UDP-3-O-(3-hydroxymyristoyl)glucosamine N-acyltransferase [Desulfovibrionaceae bacterium]|nr:UDP-3-O-(3-hydroxymyristoyl)glucosamine N-acyltransferase [Desulfovibrionaceae bacterium]
MQRSYTLAEIAERLGLKLGDEADGSLPIYGVNTLEDAGPNELSFLSNPKYAPQLDTTRAGAVIVEPKQAGRVKNALLADNSYLAFARVLHLFAKPQGEFSGQSPLAFIHPDARLEEGVTVYPFAFIGPRTTVGAGSIIFPGCYIGEDCALGPGCLIYPNAVLMAGTKLGRGTIIQPGAVLGSDGFGFVPGEKGIEKIPQIGTVSLGENVEIGANTTVDRAALGSTVIGDGSKLDNLVQIGHNVRIGKFCLLAGQSGISGSTRLGDRVILAGQAGLSGHLKVGSGAVIGPQSGLARNVNDGEVLGGSPSMPRSEFLRSSVLIPRLPELHSRIRKLEKALEALASKEE